MPKLNVYLPDTLAAAVKDTRIPVSAVCQAALAEAVERVGRARLAVSALRDPATSAAALNRLADGLRARMTPRLAEALRSAAAAPDGSVRTTVSSLDLLAGVLEDEGNLAVRLIGASHVDVDTVRQAAADATARETASAPVPGDAGLLARLSLPARLACAEAVETAVEQGHNYFGCEHLLVGLAVADCDAAKVLAGCGIRPKTLLQALAGATAGALHERNTSAQRTSDAIQEMARRLDAIERRLPATT
jgi:ATP-dependent Clp protease ATP-binding subunit ClpC